MPAGVAAREAALTVLRRVREGYRFEEAFETAVAGLLEQDRHLTHEIAAGVLRHRAQLDRSVAPLLKHGLQRLSGDLQDVLRIGAYQLIYLDRVPQYAALSTTVEVAKRSESRRAAGLINAVLRKLSRHLSVTQPDSEDVSLAERYSHPAWLVERWIRRWGAQKTEALLKHNNTPAPLTLQPAMCTGAQLKTLFTSHGISFQDAPFGLGLVVNASQVRTLPGYAQGAFIVQDAAQQRLLRSVAIPEDAVVWDACAAPGGKAVFLSRVCRQVIASDVRRDRMRVLRDTVTRAASCVSLILADARRPPVGKGSVDVVLVDAPCSATGTMARHPDARWRLSPEWIARGARMQAAILDAAATVLAPSGMLVYLTCSLEQEENEWQVDQFLQRHQGFRRTGSDMFLFPPDAGTDGGFGASMRRVA